MSEPEHPPVRAQRRGRTFTARIQTAPGQWEDVTFPAAASVRWGLCRLRQRGDGGLAADLKTWTGVYRLTEKPERDLGLPMHWQWYIVMGYLGKFFTVMRPSPAITLIDVASLMEFMAESADETYWTPERVTRWQDARRAYNGKEHKVFTPGRSKRGQPVEDKQTVTVRPRAGGTQLELF